MKQKLLFLVLSLTVVVSLGAQDKITREGYEFKGSMTADDVFQITGQGVSSKAVLLSATVYVDFGDGFFQCQCFNMDDVEGMQFFVDYTALKKTEVRFTISWIGPECGSHVSPWWVVSKSCYYAAYFHTDQKLKRGLYRLVISAEQKNVASGAESLVDCIFQVW